MPTTVDLTIDTKANTAELTRATQEAQEFINVIKLGVGIDIGGKLVEGLGQVTDFFKDAIVEGVKFNSSVQDATLALAALLKSFEPTKFHTLNDALAESGAAVDLLRKKAVSSPFNFDQLLESLQSISGVLFAGGVKDLQKQVDLTLLLASAAKTLNVPQQFLPSESRDLIEGRANRTFLGRGLNIKDEDIKKATESGKLYEFLNQQLSVYGEAGAKSIDNYSTRVSLLHDKLQQLEGVATQGIFNEVSTGLKDLAGYIDNPDFANAANTLGSQLAVIVGGVSSLIGVVASSPGLFAALAEGAVVFSVSLALLNLPSIATGLVQIATSAAPALEGMAALGAETKADGSAMAAAVANIEANTAALLANAEAAATAAAAQAEASGGAAGGGRAVVAEATTVGTEAVSAVNTEATAGETAAIEANTVAKTANAEASGVAGAAIATEAEAATVGAEEVGAAGATAGLGISAALGPITVVILALSQLYIAYEAYADRITQANADLQKNLDNQLGTLKEQVNTVANQVDQAKLITTLKDEEQRIDHAIAIAKSQSWETDRNTVDMLEKQKESVGDQLITVQGLSTAQLDMRASAQSAEQVLDAQVETAGKLAEGFEKAKTKYNELVANEQAENAPTLQGRLAAFTKKDQNARDQANNTLDPSGKTKRFSSIDDLKAFIDPAAKDAREKKYKDDDAVTKVAIEAAKQNQTQLQDAVAKQAALLEQLQAPKGHYKPAASAVSQATIDLKNLQGQLKNAGDSLNDLTTKGINLGKQHTADEAAYTAGVDVQGPLKSNEKQAKSLIKDNEDSQQKLLTSANKLAEAENERSYKARIISLEQFESKKRELLKSDYDAGVAAINRTPGRTDEDKARDLQEAQNSYQGGLHSADDDEVIKQRQEAVQRTNEQARLVSQQEEAARAAGNVNLADDLQHQVDVLQKIAQIEGDINLTEKQRADEIKSTTADMNAQYAQAQQQKDSEQDLETKEKNSADAMSKLQSNHQLIESSGLSPDDKNEVLRQNLLAQNQVLDQQIALLEQRRQLALADPTKSPNDRALTAAGIQQEKDQKVAQKTGQQIGADKLKFTGEFTSDLTSFAQSFGSTAQQAAGVVTGTLGTAVQSISTHLSNVVRGTETVRQAFIGMVEDVVVQLIELAIKLAITLAIQEALDVAGIYTAPAAGASAGTLAAGLAAAAGIGGSIASSHAMGGLVPGAPSHTDNRIAAIASGEYVTRTAAVQHYGPGLFHALNNMSIPHPSLSVGNMSVPARSSLGFAAGGLVGALPFMSGGAAQQQASPANHVHVGLLQNQAALTQWMRKGDGKKIVVDLFTGHLRDVGLTS